MFLIFGATLFGTVEHCSGSYVATEFVCLEVFPLRFLPLYPLRSYALLHGTEPLARKRIRLHWTSVLLAYARTWGGGLVLLAISSYVLSSWIDGSWTLEGWGSTVAAILALVELLVISTAGRLSRDAKAQRLAFKDLVGYAIDPVFLGPGRAEHRRAVRQEVLRHAHAYAAQDSQETYDPERQWLDMALDPRVEDPRFLVAAMTLARLEQCYAHGVPKQRYGRAVVAIWRRLRRVAPEYFEAAVYA